MSKRKRVAKTLVIDLTSPDPDQMSRQDSGFQQIEEQLNILALPCFAADVPRLERSRRRLKCKHISPRQNKKLDTAEFHRYMDNIWRNFSQDKRASIADLDCLWFALYMKGSLKAKVLTWIKKKQIFTKKYVFVPVVCWSHWSLLILCNFGESLLSKTSPPCMLLLDSLESANPKRLEPYIRKFVLDIFKVEDRNENKALISKIPLMVPKVPQQRNGEECGDFVLYYINLFIENAPETFSLEGYPYFQMNQNWFTPEGLEQFCEKIGYLGKSY